MTLLLRAVYALLLVGGLVSSGTSAKYPFTAPLFLAIAGTLAICEHRRAWKALLSAALLGLLFEVAGVHTGLPFGRYSYTSALAPSLFGVPLVIGFAWLILIDFVRGITGSPLLGALLMASIDLVIDPLAAGPLRFWTWIDHGPYYHIPTLNFVGWLFASAIILAVIPRTDRRHAYVGWTVVAWFTVLALEFRLWLPGAIGFAVLAVPVFQTLKHPRVGLFSR